GRKGGGPAAGAPKGAYAWPSRISSGQPYLLRYACATCSSVASSVTNSARPSTITSTPSTRVVNATRGLVSRLRALARVPLVVEYSRPSTHTANTGRTCGAPLARTVETQ